MISGHRPFLKSLYREIPLSTEAENLSPSTTQAGDWFVDKTMNYTVY